MLHSANATLPLRVEPQVETARERRCPSVGEGRSSLRQTCAHASTTPGTLERHQRAYDIVENRSLAHEIVPVVAGGGDSGVPPSPPNTSIFRFFGPERPRIVSLFSAEAILASAGLDSARAHDQTARAPMPMPARIRSFAQVSAD